MPKRMLIDASHPEETRVVVLDGQKVEEFDFESASKRPLKGNIYLAKVTRVEPSLQAAFVEYGGNRQGFLAFSEIHPDYYQIPVADRQALLAEAEMEARRNSEDDFESFDIKGGKRKSAKGGKADEAEADAEAETDEDEEIEDAVSDADSEGDEAAPVAAVTGDEPADALTGDSGVEFGIAEPAADEAAPQTGEAEVEAKGEDEKAADSQALSAKRPSQRWMKRRHYKIQEVIKRRQIILVQVVKEERGNKGAALTTYLSLAGRYCVLMPNTPRGGGISRKITNAADRKRLKAAAQSLELPEGMGLIIRTAGGNRTKLEIKRDYDYLLRMWDTIREQTLQSVAPSCVYEEGDLVKRAIRDLYNKDVEEVLVEGEGGYRGAKDFMRMLMPSHAKNVKLYKEPVPLYQRFHIEAQLDAMFSSTVTLKSGGYIVIDQTEALVAIDVNSGRATKEHSIEETALKTNLEAADEVGRQLRLRDLAGLIVVDFIDMEENRNDRLVEKRMMSAVKNDRARIQVGKISQFGLLELSRQRLRAGVVAGSTVPCPHCGGTGLVRSVESTSLRVLRGIEEEAQKQNADALVVHVAGEVALYVLNQKRAELTQIEKDYDIIITFEPKEDLKAGDYTIDRIGQRDPARVKTIITVDTVSIPEEPEEEPVVEEAETDEEDESAVSETAPQNGDQNGEQNGGEGRRRRRRRRRGRGGDRGERGEDRRDDRQDRQGAQSTPGGENEDGAEPTGEAQPGGESAPESSEAGDENASATGEGEGEGRRRRRRRRRGRRGGRDRNLGETDGAETADATGDDTAADDGDEGDTDVEQTAAPVATTTEASTSIYTVYEDRFGRIEDIDTTPREPLRPAAEPVNEQANEPAKEPAKEPERVEPAAVEAPIETPPVDAVHTTINEHLTEAVEAVATVESEGTVAAAVETKVAAETVAPPPAEIEPAKSEPTKSNKTGWWKRTFQAK